jgi:hypothetical protein
VVNAAARGRSDSLWKTSTEQRSEQTKKTLDSK